ncbi:MAG: xanthine dehydrogenase small subunit [Aestuariivirga sp.]
MALQFLRRGKMVTLEQFEPDQTLLDYLRLDEKSKGTKEGCNEGDCGACTVVLGRPHNGAMRYQAVNACILLLGQIHGAELITVDELAEGGKLHPVQQAMVDAHASQCGFCTPGFVMSLFALGHENPNPSREDIVTKIAGNLCRCTGYRPIVDAALTACSKMKDRWTKQSAETAKLLEPLTKDDVFVSDGDNFFAAPATAESLAELFQKHPTARIVSGATDVGLWITKQFRPLKQIIWTGRAQGFAEIVERDGMITIGGGATYADALEVLARNFPDMGEVMTRIGSAQVRASGTIGGNIANGSPIGDMPPMLIALNAKLHLQLGAETREMSLEDFFIAYGKQDRAAGELVWAIDVPKLSPHQIFKAYKISKRFDQDISAVMAAFLFTLNGNRIEKARIAFGGMAATPKRASVTEQALVGKSLTEALGVTLTDYAPIDDMRASAAYRIEAANALLRKALLEAGGLNQSHTRVMSA